MRPVKLWLSLFLACLIFSAWGAGIAIYSDSQGNEQVHGQLVSSLAEFKPALIFHCGDITPRGNKQKPYDVFLAQIAFLAASGRFFPARGNHDRSQELFLSNFPQLENRTWYSVEHDSLLFLVLDSTQDLKPGSRQYSWLQQTLEESSLKARFVILHHPVFSSGFHQGEDSLELFLPRLFAQNGVLAVFSGHDHHYERLEYQNVTYFITGGGGGVLRKSHDPHPFSKLFWSGNHYLVLIRQGAELVCSAHALDGRIIDEFRLALP